MYLTKAWAYCAYTFSISRVRAARTVNSGPNFGGRTAVGNCWALVPVLGAALFFISGCASISGMQDAVTATDLHKGVCPSQAELDVFNTKTGTARREYRDAVILDCIKAINKKYDAFKASLQNEAVNTNLITDVLSLGLTTGAALTKGQTAKELAAGGAFAIGTGTAINKDVFYQQALPAIESAMDAKRDTLLKGIVDSEGADPDATKYTLASAGIDLDAYESAGNLYAAISELTKTANVAAQAAKAELTASQTRYEVQVLSPTVFTRLKKITDYVRALKEPVDRAKLDAIASKLNIRPQGNFEQERVDIIDVVVKRINTGDQNAQIDALEKDLMGLYN